MSGAHTVVLACVVVGTLALGEREAHAQGRDSLLNGTVIGAAVGAGAGVAFTHAVRDSDLGFDQYAYGALVFGAIGAGVGLGVDALFNRASTGPRETPPRVLIAPTIWRHVAGVVVKWLVTLPLDRPIRTSQ
jgi:hypothetical protein